MATADMAELADAPDLGSGISDVQVQVLLSAPAIRIRTFFPLEIGSDYLFADCLLTVTKLPTCLVKGLLKNRK